MLNLLLKVLAGTSFCLVLLLTSVIGSVFIIGPMLPLVYINEKLFRKLVDMALPLWLILPGAIMELLCGTTVKISGDKTPKDECALIIMNHRCRLDWMFYWMVLLRNGNLSHEKIIMREDLRYLPGPGWAMQCAMYLFLRRKWEHDKGYLTRVFNYFLDIKYPVQLLIFPEGTNYCKEGKEKSDSFARKNNLVIYNHVLHPRVTGFNFIVQKLRDEALDAVHDVTIGYKNGFCYGESDLIMAKFPGEIHVHVKRYDINSLPQDSESIDKWCVQRWSEKEKRLAKFEKEGRFDEEDSFTEEDHLNMEGNARQRMKGILAFWFIFTVALFYSFWKFWFMKWFMAIIFFYHIYQMYFNGGLDCLQLTRHEQWKNTDSSKDK